MSGALIPLMGQQPNPLGAWQAGANIANTQNQALRTAAQTQLVGQQTQGQAIQNQLARLGLAYQRWWYGLFENRAGGAPPSAAPGAMVAAAPHPAALAASPLGNSPLTGGSAPGTPVPVQATTLPPPGGSPAAGAENAPVGSVAYFQQHWGGIDIGQGFSLPYMQGLMALKDPSKVASMLPQLYAMRRQQVATAMQQADTPQAWNQMVLRETELGYMHPQTAARLWNGFGNRSAALASLADPNAQLSFQGGLLKGGMTMGPGGNPVPSATAGEGQYVLSSGRTAGAPISLAPGTSVSLPPAAAGMRGTAPGGPATSTEMTAPGPMSVPSFLQRVQGFEQPVPGVNPTTTSAIGPYQFTRETWAQVMPGVPFSEANNPTVAAQAASKFAAQNASTLRAAGMPVTAASLGAAHLFGANGAIALMKAPANTPIERVEPPQDIANNPWMRGLTAGQVATRIVQSYGVAPINIGAQPAVSAPTVPPGLPGNTAAPPSGPGAGAPGVQAGQGGTVLANTLSPGNVAAQKANVSKWVAQQGEYTQQASEATNANGLLDQVKTEFGTWTPGSFAEWRMKAQNFIDTARRMAGLPGGVAIGDYQAFVKNQSQLAAAATRAISSRPAAIEFQQMMRALPNPDMSPQGLMQVTSELQGINDWKIARGALAARYDGTADPARFGAQFNNTVPIAPFIFNRMPAPQLAQMHATLMKTPAGRATWATWVKQYQAANAQGLFNLLPTPGG